MTSSENEPSRPKPWWRTAWGRFATVIGFVSAVLGIISFVVPLLTGGEVGNQPAVTATATANPTPTPPATPIPTATASLPLYRGRIGDLAGGEPFIAFVTEHDGEIVRIDAELAVRDYTVDPADPDVPSSFRIWNDCRHGRVPRELPERECLGWQYTLVPRSTTDSSLYIGSGVHLEGWFAVQVRGGLHMGLTFATLKPLTQERALALRPR